MKKCHDAKVVVIIFSLLFLFTPPSVSFANTLSDIQFGNVDNTLKMSFDSRGSVSPDYILDHHGPRHDLRQPQATPVPAAFWLLGSGLVGLIGIKRKLQK